jgi:hypothetical protein
MHITRCRIKKYKIRAYKYVYVLDGIATANGEVGITGSRSSPCQMSPRMAKHGEPRESSRFILLCCKQFQFQIETKVTA